MQMRGLGLTKWVIGFCLVLAAGSALADGNPFVGRWHWNRVQSSPPPGQPVPADVVAEITRADSTHMRWSLTVLASQGQTSVETFDAVANGEFYPINNDTTAAFSLNGSLLQATFKGPSGETDALTCTLSADQRKMTCRGTLSDGDGRTTSYVDIYDRM
jgi:hypothetical protein